MSGNPFYQLESDRHIQIRLTSEASVLEDHKQRLERAAEAIANDLRVVEAALIEQMEQAV